MSAAKQFSNATFKRALLLTTVRVVIPTIILLYSNDMVAEEPKKWRPQIDLNIKYGNKRDIGRIGAFGPIAQTNDMLSFVDFRFMAETRSNQEGNFGLGHRWIDPNLGVIWGGYGYYDRRSSNLGNKYNQLTFGAECLSLTWDYRANVYFPERKVYTKTTTIKNENVGDVTGRGYTKGQPGVDYVATQKEVPLKGIDVEVGRAIPDIPSLRLYAGTYYYQGRAGVESIKGYHTRTDFEINEYFTIQAEAKRDNVRKNNFYLGVELRIPLGKETAKTRGLTDLEKRMTIAPMRDVDIVANDKTETVIVPTYHVLADNVHYVLPDGEKNGVLPDGTFERPFRDAAEYKKHLENNPNAENAQTLIADHQMHGEIVSRNHFLGVKFHEVMLMQKGICALKRKNPGHSITGDQLFAEMQSYKEPKKHIWTFKRRNQLVEGIHLAAKRADFAGRIQSIARMRSDRAKFLAQKNATINIQRFTRGHLARKAYKDQLKKIVLTQSIARMHNDRTKFLAQKKATINIQRFARGHLARKQAKYLREEARVAAWNAAQTTLMTHKLMYDEAVRLEKVRLSKIEQRISQKHNTLLKKETFDAWKKLTDAKAFSRNYLLKRTFVEWKKHKKLILPVADSTVGSPPRLPLQRVIISPERKVAAKVHSPQRFFSDQSNVTPNLNSASMSSPLFDENGQLIGARAEKSATKSSFKNPSFDVENIPPQVVEVRHAHVVYGAVDPLSVKNDSPKKSLNSDTTSYATLVEQTQDKQTQQLHATPGPLKLSFGDDLDSSLGFSGESFSSLFDDDNDDINNDVFESIPRTLYSAQQAFPVANANISVWGDNSKTVFDSHVFATENAVVTTQYQAALSDSGLVHSMGADLVGTDVSKPYIVSETLTPQQLVEKASALGITDHGVIAGWQNQLANGQPVVIHLAEKSIRVELNKSGSFTYYEMAHSEGAQSNFLGAETSPFWLRRNQTPAKLDFAQQPLLLEDASENSFAPQSFATSLVAAKAVTPVTKIPSKLLRYVKQTAPIASLPPQIDLELNLFSGNFKGDVRQPRSPASYSVSPGSEAFSTSDVRYMLDDILERPELLSPYINDEIRAAHDAAKQRQTEFVENELRSIRGGVEAQRRDAFEKQKEQEFKEANAANSKHSSHVEDRRKAEKELRLAEESREKLAQSNESALMNQEDSRSAAAARYNDVSKIVNDIVAIDLYQGLDQLYDDLADEALTEAMRSSKEREETNLRQQAYDDAVISGALYNAQFNAHNDAEFKQHYVAEDALHVESLVAAKLSSTEKEARENERNHAEYAQLEMKKEERKQRQIDGVNNAAALSEFFADSAMSNVLASFDKSAKIAKEVRRAEEKRKTESLAVVGTILDDVVTGDVFAKLDGRYNAAPQIQKMVRGTKAYKAYQNYLDREEQKADELANDLLHTRVDSLMEKAVNEEARRVGIASAWKKLTGKLQTQNQKDAVRIAAEKLQIENATAGALVRQTLTDTVDEIVTDAAAITSHEKHSLKTGLAGLMRNDKERKRLRNAEAMAAKVHAEKLKRKVLGQWKKASDLSVNQRIGDQLTPALVEEFIRDNARPIADQVFTEEKDLDKRSLTMSEKAIAEAQSELILEQKDTEAAKITKFFKSIIGSKAKKQEQERINQEQLKEQVENTSMLTEDALSSAPQVDDKQVLLQKQKAELIVSDRAIVEEALYDVVPKVKDLADFESLFGTAEENTRQREERCNTIRHDLLSKTHNPAQDSVIKEINAKQEAAAAEIEGILAQLNVLEAQKEQNKASITRHDSRGKTKKIIDTALRDKKQVQQKYKATHDAYKALTATEAKISTQTEKMMAVKTTIAQIELERNRRQSELNQLLERAIEEKYQEDVENAGNVLEQAGKRFSDSKRFSLSPVPSTSGVIKGDHAASIDAVGNSPLGDRANPTKKRARESISRESISEWRKEIELSPSVDAKIDDLTKSPLPNASSAGGSVIIATENALQTSFQKIELADEKGFDAFLASKSPFSIGSSTPVNNKMSKLKKERRASSIATREEVLRLTEGLLPPQEKRKIKLALNSDRRVSGLPDLQITPLPASSNIKVSQQVASADQYVSDSHAFDFATTFGSSSMQSPVSKFAMDELPSPKKPRRSSLFNLEDSGDDIYDYDPNAKTVTPVVGSSKKSTPGFEILPPSTGRSDFSLLKEDGVNDSDQQLSGINLASEFDEKDASTVHSDIVA